MSKLTMIGILLCATVFVAECVDIEKPTLSRHLTVTLPKSTTVACGDSRKGSGILWTVSVTKSNVHVNSSDPNNKPCDLAIDLDKDSIEGEIKVAVTNRYMYILGEHGVEKVDGQDKTKYTLLIVSLEFCSLEKADVPLGKVTNSLPDMVVQQYGVDLFFPKMDTCAPCQFSNDGKRLTKVVPQIPPPAPNADGFPYSFHMGPLGHHKYIYAQNMEGDKAMLKVLDNEKMDVLKEKQVDYPVNSIVKSNVVASMVGICSKKLNRMLMDIAAYKEINCVGINENLETHAPIKITIEPSRPVSSVSYDGDKYTDKIYIGFATDQNLGVLVYDNKGKLVKNYDLGKIDERFNKYKHQPMFYSPYSHWDVHGFVVGKEYCLVTKQVSYTDNHEVDLHDVRCINTLE